MGTNIQIPPEASKDIVAFTQRLLGPAADAADFLGDKIRFYRWRSALRTLQRAEEFALEQGIEPKEVPLKFLVPFLEKCSLEDEESELVDAWANLLIGAIGEYSPLHMAYTDILAKMSFAEATFLKNLAEITPERSVGNYLLEDEKTELQILVDQSLDEFIEHFDAEKNEDYCGRKFHLLTGFSPISNSDQTKFSSPALMESEYLYLLEQFGLIRLYSASFRLKESPHSRVKPPRQMRATWYRITSFGYDLVMTCENKPTLEQRRRAEIEDSMQDSAD